MFRMRQFLDGGPGTPSDDGTTSNVAVVDPPVPPVNENEPGQGELSDADKAKAEEKAQREEAYQEKYQNLMGFLSDNYPEARADFKGESPPLTASEIAGLEATQPNLDPLSSITNRNEDGGQSKLGFGVDEYDPNNPEHAYRIAHYAAQNVSVEKDKTDRIKNVADQVKSEELVVVSQLRKLVPVVPNEIMNAAIERANGYRTDRNVPGGWPAYAKAIADGVDDLMRKQGLIQHTTNIAADAAEKAKNVARVTQPPGASSQPDARPDNTNPQLAGLKKTLEKGGSLASDKLMGT